MPVRRSRSGRASAASLALVALAGSVVGCGTSAAPTPLPTSVPVSPRPSSASTSPAIAVRTFPPSQTAIEPGTYRWAGFDPPISVALGSGWALGHDNTAYFDLFRGSDFPSISFARFTDVYTDGTHRAPATDASTVAATLAGRTNMTVSHPQPIDLGSMHGLQFDLMTTAGTTPLFFGPAGDFRLDPEFKTRYRVLDFPGGGILVIGVHAHTGAFDDGISLAEPVVMTAQLDRS